MREADLALPISKWMETQGYTVYAEIPMLCRCVDLVGKDKEDKLVAIELKKSLTESLRRQTQTLGLFAESVYCGIGTNPKQSSVEWCKKRGVGIVVVKNGEVVELLSPNLDRPPLPHYTKQCLDILAIAIPGHNAGKPNALGVGPAQDVRRSINEYWKEHPGATWKELYREIPNHYESYKSMYGGMRMLEIRKRLRKATHDQ